MTSKSIKESLNDFYYGVESKFFDLMDFLDDHGVPIYRVIDAFEDKNIPVFPVFLAIFFIGLIAFSMVSAPSIGVLNIKIVDSETGLFVTDAEITISYSNPTNLFIGKTDSKGIATIENFDRLNDYATVEIKKYGYETFKKSFLFNSFQQDFSISKLIVTNVVATMNVTSDSDQIIRNGTVKIMKDGEVINTYLIGENGVIDITVPKGEKLNYVVNAPGYLEKSEPITVNSDQRLLIKLEEDTSEPADLVIYVKDVNNKVVEGAVVEVRQKGIADLVSFEKTDSDGKVISRGLLTGSLSAYNVTVSKEGYLSTTESNIKLLSNIENSIELTILTADFANSDFINIAAKTMTGNPLTATVNVYLDNVIIKSKEITGTGQILVDKSKKYMVSVYSNNYVAFVKTNVGAGDLVTAAMEVSDNENTSSLRVCVRDEKTKAPLKGISVVLFETSSKVLGMPSELTNSNGCAEFMEVPNGKTVIAKAYVGSTISSAEQVTTPTTQEPQIDISATQTKVKVKVMKENLEVSGAKVTLFNNSAIVLNKEFSSPLVTDSNGIVEFDVVEGTQIYAVVESIGSAKYFSQVLNVDASKENKINVQLQNTTDSTGVVFIGLFDKFGNKTESVVGSKQYHVRVALNTATLTDESGLFLMTGLEKNSFAAEDNVAIVGVMQAMGEPYSSSTYTPPLGEEIDSMSTSLLGQSNKWVQIIGNDVDKGTHVVDFVVQIKDDVISGEKVQFNYRGWTYINLGTVDRSPIDEELETVKDSDSKQGLYANTNKVEFSVTQNTLDCVQEVCLNYKFAKAITEEEIKNLTESEMYLAGVYSLALEINAKEDMENLEVEISNSDSSVDFVSHYYLGNQTELAESTHSFALNLVNLAKNMKTGFETVFIPTVENNSVSIKMTVKKSGKVLLEKELFLKVVAGLALKVSVDPKMVVSGEKTQFVVTVLRAGDLEKVTDATVRFVNNIGKPLGDNTITIIGKNKKNKGLNGQYVSLIEPASGVIAVNVSADHFAEKTVFVRVGKEAAIAIDEDPFVIEIPLNIKTATKQLAIKNNSSKNLTDLQIVIEHDDDFSEDDFSLELEGNSIVKQLGPGETTYLTFTSSYFPDSIDSALAQATLKVFAVKDNEYVTAQGRIKLMYAPKIDSKILADCLEVTPSKVEFLPEFLKNSTDQELPLDFVEVVLTNNCGMDLSNIVAFSDNSLDGGMFVFDYNGKQVIESDKKAIVEFISGSSKSGENSVPITVIFQPTVLENNGEKLEDIVGTLVFRGKNGSQDISGELDYNVVFWEDATNLTLVSDTIKMALKAGETLLIEDNKEENLIIKNNGPMILKNISASLDLSDSNLEPSVNVILSHTESNSVIDEILPGKMDFFDIEVDARNYSGKTKKMYVDIILTADLVKNGDYTTIKQISRKVKIEVEILPQLDGCIKIVGDPILEFASVTTTFDKITDTVVVKNECGVDISSFSKTFNFDNFKMTAEINGKLKNNEIKELLFSVKPVDQNAVVINNFSESFKLRSGSDISSQEFKAIFDIGGAATISNFSTVSAVDYCDFNGTVAVERARRAEEGENCDVGYCDSVKAAEYISRKSVELIDSLKQVVGTKTPSQIGCGFEKEGVCTFEELLSSGNIKSEWMNGQDLFFTDDRMTLTMLNNARDKVYFTGLTKQGSYSNAVTNAATNVSLSKSLYYDLDSDNALDKCGWYKIKLKPVLSYGGDELLFNNYFIAIETTYVGETQACSASPLNASTLLPWNDTSKWNLLDSSFGLTETRNVVLVTERDVNKKYENEIASVLSGVDLDTFNNNSDNFLKGHKSQAVNNAKNSDKNVLELKATDRKDLNLGKGEELTSYYDALPIYGVLSYDSSSESDFDIKNHLILDIVNDPFGNLSKNTKYRSENNVNFTWKKAMLNIINGGQVDGCFEPEGSDSSIKRFVITGIGNSGGVALDSLSRNTCVFPTSGLLNGLEFDLTDKNTIVVTNPDVLTHLIACECGAALLNMDSDAGRFGTTGYNIRYEPADGNSVFNIKTLVSGLAKLKEGGSEPASVFCADSKMFGGDCKGCPPQIIFGEQEITKGTKFKPVITVEEKGFLGGTCKPVATACIASAVTTVAKTAATVTAATPPGALLSGALWVTDMAVDSWAGDQVFNVILTNIETKEKLKEQGQSIAILETITSAKEYSPLVFYGVYPALQGVAGLSMWKYTDWASQVFVKSTSGGIIKGSLGFVKNIALTPFKRFFPVVKQFKYAELQKSKGLLDIEESVGLNWKSMTTTKWEKLANVALSNKEKELIELNKYGENIDDYRVLAKENAKLAKEIELFKNIESDPDYVFKLENKLNVYKKLFKNKESNINKLTLKNEINSVAEELDLVEEIKNSNKIDLMVRNIEIEKRIEELKSIIDDNPIDDNVLAKKIFEKDVEIEKLTEEINELKNVTTKMGKIGAVGVKASGLTTLACAGVATLMGSSQRCVVNFEEV